MGSSCPSGTTLIDGVCYGECPNNYTQLSNGLCAKDCPSGFRQSGTVCNRASPSSYTRGTGYLTESQCVSVTSQPCETCGNEWFPTCMSGFQPSTCNVCTRVCPNGSLDKVCTTDIITPATTLPSISLSTILAIVIIVIILFAIVVNAFTGTRTDVTSIIVGNPSDDAFSELQGLTYNNQDTGLIYV